MMGKIWCFLLFIYSLFLYTACEATPHIAFERNGSIWTAQLDGSHSKKVAKGSWPDIASNGKVVAYNTDDDNHNSVVRQLAIANLPLGEIKLLKAIPSDNSFNPKWSPDNKKLLFNTFINGNWHIALIDRDDTHYQLIKNTNDKFQPVWSADKQSFFCHDLKFIYWLNLEGDIIKKWDIHAVFPDSEMNSASHLDVSPDNKWLIVDVDSVKSELSSVIWIFEIASGKATRLNQNGSNPVWVNEKEFFFTQRSGNQSSLYRATIDSDTSQLVLRNVSLPSVSKKK